jgi:Tfp pilus assembly protein PilX
MTGQKTVDSIISKKVKEETIVKTVKPLKDQKGAALVIALIMIVVLTLIGLASTFTSNFEIKLSGNKRGSTDAFYGAESGAQIAQSNVGYFSYTTNTSTPVLNPNPTNAVVTINRELNADGTPRQDAPRGTGISATSFEFEHHLVQSAGQDQVEVALVRAQCTLEEKVVRLLPTLQGGS